MTRYCVILWDVLTDMKVSVAEYALLDTVYVLQRKTGHCYASRKYLAQNMRLTERGLIKIIDRLVERGLLAKTPSGKVFVTENWSHIYHEQSTEDHEQSSSKPMNKVHENHEQSSFNINVNNKNDINIDKGSYRKVTDFYQAKMESLMNGKKPILDWPVITKTLKPIFDKLGEMETIKALKAYFSDPWVCEHGYRITTFKANILKYQGISSYDPAVGLGLNEFVASNQATLNEAVHGKKEEVSNM